MRKVFLGLQYLDFESNF